MHASQKRIMAWSSCQRLNAHEFSYALAFPIEFPNEPGRIVHPGNQPLAVGHERQRPHLAAADVDRTDLALGGDAPEPDAAAGLARRFREQLAIARKGDRTRFLFR